MKLQKKKKGSLRTSTNYWEELSISIETMKEKRKRKSKKIQCMLLAYLEWIKQSGKGSVTWACLQTLHNKQSNCFIAVHTDSRMKVSIFFAEISGFGGRRYKSKATPRTDPENTGSKKKKKGNLSGFPWGFCMDFLGNQTRMNFPGKQMGDGFSWESNGVAEK